MRTVSTTAEITPPFSFGLSWLTTRLGQSSELIRLPALVPGAAFRNQVVSSDNYL